jgi:dimethylargininase
MTANFVLTLWSKTMLIALTRAVSPSINQCELTHLAREPIDFERAQAQHEAYQAALAAHGCRVIPLPAEPSMPDAVFVEDTALVLDEIAIITRLGTESRRAEISSVAEALRPYRKLASIEAPGTLDGGDVLRVGKQIYVGLSQRSNAAGIEQLRRLVTPLGYTVTALEVRGCLHLKTAVTQVAPETLLINRNLIDPAPFEQYQLVDVAADEPLAGNALWLNGTVIYPAEHKNTRQALEALGVTVEPVPAAELAKAEGGVTCCSLIFEADIN